MMTFDYMAWQQMTSTSHLSLVPVLLLGLGGSALAQGIPSADGACGSAATSFSTIAPINDLCASGEAGPVAGNGPWAWRCEGIGIGKTSSCSSLSSPGGSINGGGETPSVTEVPRTETLGIVQALPTRAGGTSISDTPSPNSSGQSFYDEMPLQRASGLQEYSETKAYVPISGQCGSASGRVVTSQPSSSLCSIGNATSVQGPGPWIWQCLGSYGGPNANCRAPSLGSLAAVADINSTAVLLSQDQRTTIGIKDGPDSPTDFYTAKNGLSYILSSGSAYVNSVLTSGTYEIRVDSQMTTPLALNSDGPAGAGDIRVLLADHASECKPGGVKLKQTDPGGLSCSEYFDRDYAGGGTYFLCPNGQTSVYFFHGENHTPPDGSTNHNGGWSGNGVAYFDDSETVLTRSTQMPTDGGTTTAEIDGINLSNIWVPFGTQYPNPPQAQMYSDAASVVPSPDGSWLYVYHGDATLNSLYNPAYCNPGACDAVSGAPVAAFCQNVKTSAPSQFLNYYGGQFSQPAAFGSGAALGYGSGGVFTPAFLDAVDHDHGGSVSYIPSRSLYVMLRLLTRSGNPGVSIDARFSVDGLNWTGPQLLVGPPTGTTPYGDAESLIYPRIHVISSGGTEQYVLTYTLVTAQDFWKWAELVRVPVLFNF